VLITAHGGFNFYMGNHEGATGYPVKIGSFRSDRESLLKDARAEAERAAGRPVTSAEFSSYWSDKARAFLRGEPAAAARLFGLKLMKFWNREEFDDLRLLPVLRLAGVVPAERWCVSFALIGTAGLAGLFLLRQARIAKFALAAGMLSLLLFFITARYRLTLVPLLCAVGAAGIGTVYAEGRYRSGAVALLVSAVVVLWPVSRPDFLALDRYKTAAHLLQAGMAEEALVQADLGLRTDPSVAGLHFVRGNALVGQGRWADAAESYAEAIRINPVMPDAHFNRAVCLKQVGDIAGAVAEAQLALELDPRHERAAGPIKELR
ncbi:MAG TPA: tetratricopeptide repeat protein, partial [Kiritimatiellia bacterium]